MVAKRIIPCLDILDGRVVKGVNFVSLIDAGDPVEIAKAYNKMGADEIVFLMIAKGENGYEKNLKVLEMARKNVSLPLTIGGGISDLETIDKYLKAGADKVSINSFAINNPKFLKDAVDKFGSQCIVSAIDFKKVDNKYKVFINGGKKETDLELMEWVNEVHRLKVGEILLTSMDKDGTKSGYDIEATKLVCDSVTIPVIASGGAGKKEDFVEVFNKTNCDGALAASVFHFNEINMKELKEYLKQKNIHVR